LAGLVLAGVRKDYGELTALRDLDLDAADGELLVLLGPSGSGKSTVLRVVAGLEEATAGTVLIGGRDVTRVAPGGRDVAMVFQNYALFPHLDVAANIAFGLKARGLARTEVSERVAEAARLAGCEEFLDRKPFRLSGGERQRVALARALARRPDVFLLDEPLSNLDAQLRAVTRAELKALHQRVGGTMLYVTHDQVEALTLGDRIAVLRAGELQQVAGPDELYRRPTNRFVASFVGSPPMNFLPPGGGPFAVAGPAGAEVGVRPEQVRIGEGGVEAVVEVVEPAGNETYVHLSVDGHRLVARAAAEVRPDVGSTTRLSLAGEPHFFDVETGERSE
jgi:multiple sugar transport system ATP-binding protein